MLNIQYLGVKISLHGCLSTLTEETKDTYDNVINTKN